MDYETFWNRDPLIINAYQRSAALDREKWEYEEEYRAWLVGSYVYEGVAVVLDHAFSKRAQSEYPRNPRKTPSERKKEQTESAQTIDPNVALFQAQFDRWATQFNKQFSQQGS